MSTNNSSNSIKPISMPKYSSSFDQAMFDEKEMYLKYIYMYEMYNKDHHKETIEKKNKVMKTFPYDSSMYTRKETEEYLKNKGLTKGTNYETIDSLSYVFFKNKNDKVEFEDFKNLKDWHRKTISNAEDELEKSYSRIVFIKSNKLEASINVMPRKDKCHEMIDAVIGFYILNNYNLPESTSNFVDNMFVINREKNYFTILLRDQNEASQLVLRLSDVAEVIT